MRPFHAFTRGGQLAVHQYRMLKQICVVTVLLSLLGGVCGGAFFLLKNTSSYQRSLYKDFLVSEFRVSTTFGDPSQLTQVFTYPHGRKQTVRSVEFLRNSWVKKQVRLVEQQVQKSLQISLWVLGITVSLIIGFFVVSGRKVARKKLERGNRVVTVRGLKKLITQKRQASDLDLDSLPLLKNKETSHILITGTTGSGKTNCFHTLLPQIRRRPNRAIIVDLTGDFVNRYYRAGQDILLSPFDPRTVLWSPWGECLSAPHYDAFASAVVAKSATTEPFWESAAKALLASALKELAKHGERNIERLYEILVTEDFLTFSRFFQNTEAATYTHPEGEKMTLSIRATLANHLQSFRYLKTPPEDHPEQSFSIRNWIADEKSPRDQWVFLASRPDQRETLRPLLSAWIDTAINGLMSLSPSPQRRLWFILDELPSLQRLPSLEGGLAEARKYGGCFMAGVQSIPQISTTYGNTQAQSMLDLFNTKVFFRNTDPTTTTWISKVLGEAEITENIENLSYGANTMRDGVNLAQQTITKPLVLPSEIGVLKDCEAYLKLPGDFPVTRLQMQYKK